MNGRKKQLVGLLGEFLGNKRLAHSLNVAETSEKLAEEYAPGLVGKAWVAGLLHDNAKKLKPRELIQIASGHDIGMGMLEIKEPGLLHGKVGAVLLQGRFGVDDPEIHQAIADHVAGRAGMGMLSKLLYVADQIADDRSFGGVDELRQVAWENLDQAVWMVARNKLKYIVSQGRALLPDTVDLYNSLLGIN